MTKRGYFETTSNQKNPVNVPTNEPNQSAFHTNL